jgi:hypothetical protein
MGQNLPTFVGGTLDFDIADEVVHVLIDGQQVSAMSLRKAEVAALRLNKVIAEYKAKRGKLLDFGRS